MTLPGLSLDQIQLLTRWAASTARVSSLIVFGSRARGDHRPDSDVDVLVELTEDADVTAAWVWLDRRTEWNAETSALLNLDVRLVRITDDDDGGIGQGVRADGVQLYPA